MTNVRSQDVTLRDDLKAVLRSIIATDIMLHPLTMDDKSRSSIISQMRNQDYNNPNAYGEFTSPKLANRQFKTVIQKLQDEFCKDVLGRLHKILRTGRGSKKGSTWLSSFVFILATAMCLEELEHNRYLRADGDVQRRSTTHESAMEDARRDCQRIEVGFDFLLDLFNRKYSPQKRYIANLEQWVKTYNNAAEQEFLQRIVQLVMPHRKDFPSPSIECFC